MESTQIDVLIVDDSEGVRYFVERSLRLADANIGRCHHAGSGLQALDFLQKEQVQLILTDLHMDGMDGRELIRCIRAKPALKDIMIAVVTSEQSDRTRTEVHELGASYYLVKPLKPQAISELFAKVRGGIR